MRAMFSYSGDSAISAPQQDTVAQKIAPMFACYGKTHALLNDYIR